VRDRFRLARPVANRGSRMANGTDDHQVDATADGNILGWDRTTYEGVVRFF